MHEPIMGKYMNYPGRNWINQIFMQPPPNGIWSLLLLSLHRIDLYAALFHCFLFRFCSLPDSSWQRGILSLHKVLRMQTGETIHLTDGTGNLYEGQILDQDAKYCPVMLTSVIFGYGKRSFRLHLAVAPTKNMARFEWFLEKATEIGIDEITPLICEHSEKDANPDRPPEENNSIGSQTVT